MSALPEIDRADPGYLRHCVRPDCKAAFNALDVMEGRASAAGWRQFRVLIGYICPEHAGPVTDGTHQPSWGRDPADDVVKSIICSCGWEWSPYPRAMVAVQHEYQDQWVAHLMSLG
jgi:hypothetical protein